MTLTPAHPPREETPEYAKAHKFLVHEKKQGCAICGVTIDTVRAPDTIETHHSPVERSLAHAVDWRKVHQDYPSVYSQESFEAWIDSPENLITLCSTHHRSIERGIHHLTMADWTIQKYLLDGYQVAATPQDEAQALAKDEAIQETAERKESA